MKGTRKWLVVLVEALRAKATAHPLAALLVLVLLGAMLQYGAEALGLPGRAGKVLLGLFGS